MADEAIEAALTARGYAIRTAGDEPNMRRAVAAWCAWHAEHGEFMTGFQQAMTVAWLRQQERSLTTTETK